MLAGGSVGWWWVTEPLGNVFTCRKDELKTVWYALLRKMGDKASVNYTEDEMNVVQYFIMVHLATKNIDKGNTCFPYSPERRGRVRRTGTSWVWPRPRGRPYRCRHPQWQPSVGSSTWSSADQRTRRGSSTGHCTARCGGKPARCAPPRLASTVREKVYE